LTSWFIRFLSFALTAVVLCAGATPVFAQTKVTYPDTEDGPDCSSPEFGSLVVDANNVGAADVFLQGCFPPKYESELRQKLPAALACQSEHADFSAYRDADLIGLEFSCEVLLSRTAMRYSREIDVAAVQEILRDAGIETLNVRLWMPNASAKCDPEPQKTFSHEARGCTWALKGSEGDPRVIRFSFGYDRDSIARIWSILGVLLLIPIAITLWFRRRATGAAEESKPKIVFAYRRFISGTLIGGLLVWWTAIDFLHADEFASFLVRVNSREGELAVFLPWILVWIPPALVYFLCLALSSPIHSLRGVTRTQSEAVWQSFWGVARLTLPISLFIGAAAELFDKPRVGVLLFFVGIFVSKLIQRKLAASHNMELQALTSGELRDRTFALAEKARAKLNQLYVMPAERMRMANAFAHSANNIFLTDYLLKNLNKREVDAIVAHEVTHLQKKHILGKVGVLIVALIGVAFAVGWSEQLISPNFPIGPVLYVFVILVVFFVSRRNEFAADAGSVKLTGDAEALITGLAKISRLNTMPIHWGKLDEKMLTHPSTLRRIRQLARAGDISEARIPELLAHSADAPTDVYPVPSTVSLSGKVFSTRFKTQLANLNAWTLMLAAAIIPTLVALLIQRTHLEGSSREEAYVAGLLLTVGCYGLLLNFLPLRGMQKLATRLREKLANEKADPEILRGLCVSLAPDSSPRVYEGNWTWDIGFLAISPDNLSYWGEEARFVLHRDQITRIELGIGQVGWFNIRDAYITWQDAGGEEHTFSLCPLRAGSMLRVGKQTRELFNELESWRRGIQPPQGSLLSTAGTATQSELANDAPSFGRVTSVSPRTIGRGRFLVRMFTFDTFVAVGVAILLGLRFPILDDIAPQSGPTDFTSTGGAVLYVLATVWIVRILVLLPFWRYREESAPVHIAVSSASSRPA
jgi:Zn-dependent protease with chaperone function